MDTQGEVKRHSEDISLYHTSIPTKKIVNLLICNKKPYWRILLKQKPKHESLSSDTRPENLLLLHVLAHPKISNERLTIGKGSIWDRNITYAKQFVDIMVRFLERVIKILTTLQKILSVDIKAKKQRIVHINRYQIHIDQVTNLQDTCIQAEILSKIDLITLWMLSNRPNELRTVKLALW